MLGESAKIQKIATMRAYTFEWAPAKVLFVTEVNNTSDGVPIKSVRVESVHVEGIRRAIATSQQIIDLLQFDDVYVLTLARDAAGNMWCAEVVDYDTESGTFIRTKADKTTQNNFDNLPVFKLLPKPSFNTLKELAIHLFS